MPKKSESGPFYARGLRFSCTRCSTCCRFESGFVFLSEKDASLLGTTLKMRYDEFTETFCRWIPSSDGAFQLSLKEKPNYDCVFWSSKAAANEGGCSVYETRPLQCRAFPFWASLLGDEDSWEEAARDCPGMNNGPLNSRDSIEKWLAMRQMEPIISRNV